MNDIQRFQWLQTLSISQLKKERGKNPQWTPEINAIIRHKKEENAKNCL